MLSEFMNVVRKISTGETEYLKCGGRKCTITEGKQTNQGKLTELTHASNIKDIAYVSLKLDQNINEKETMEKSDKRNG